MKDFKEVNVWMKAHQLTLQLYQATREFPRDEIYGLTSQMRRAPVSVGANIAEGGGRHSDGEFTRFLQIARGSASELEYHLLLSCDLRILPKEEFLRLERELVTIQRMLTALVQRVQPIANARQPLKAERKSPLVARSYQPEAGMRLMSQLVPKDKFVLASKEFSKQRKHCPKV
jgi:four helix bundle protein